MKTFEPTSRRQRGPPFETLGTTISRVLVEPAELAVMIDVEHPEYSTDMTGAISVAEALLPGADLVQVQAGDEVLYSYVRQATGWIFAEKA